MVQEMVLDLVLIKEIFGLITVFLQDLEPASLRPKVQSQIKSIRNLVGKDKAPEFIPAPLYAKAMASLGLRS
eukprot:5716904-Amphidinium_carterae.2